ncbi:DUF4232 domain-containing protein [Streptomyces sp. NRRL F-4428]|uniref:DUF4232 domain-containing protein n=1 Tax=Streptomyces sp. NRRL F-4428 TaxID=1609137 RepID=UPI000AB3D841|nr:DUF4232 domain-containing protein [Streptomyces sp. NRRL F-4428]
MACIVKGAAGRGRARTALGVAVCVAAALLTATPAAASAAAPAPACRSGQLAAGGAERMGANAVLVTVVNEGPGPCVLRGHPTVAVAGQGAPSRARSLTVVRQGPARPVRLEVGAAAQTRIGFVPVLGEADGYCASGAEPFAAPSMVIGVAGSRLQLAPDDGGNFALCGDAVRATAFRPAS